MGRISPILDAFFVIFERFALFLHEFCAFECL